MNKEEQVKAKALNLFEHYGLTDWTFKLDNAKCRHGLCRFTKKIISLSKGYVQAAKDKDIDNTILHEIAHALVGVKHKHNEVWRKKAVEIGCNGSRLGFLTFVKYKWKGTCNGCGKIFERHRRLLRGRCGKCGSDLKWEVQ
jgi:predicted SprT family Zn-dependent metalloprotease